MATSSSFPVPKDPSAQAWYLVRWGEPLAAVASVVITGSDGNTPTLVCPEQTTSPDTYSAKLFLTGGANGVTYNVRIGVTTAAGNLLFATVLLQVATQ